MQPNRLQAINAARELLKHQPVYLDTETTGTDSLDEVIEIAVLDTDGQVLYESLVKPKRPISRDAARVHGITEAQVYMAPSWETVWPQVKKVLQERWLAVYNIEFDLRMMRQSCGLHGIPWETPMAGRGCIMELFAQYFGEVNRRYGGYKWKSLDFAGRYFKIPQPNSHRASDDTLLSKLVLEKIAEGNDG